MATMTEKAMTKAIEAMGLHVVTLNCSGYKRLQAYRPGHSPVYGTEKAVAEVETTNCSLPEARALLVAAAKKAVGQ